MTHRSERLLPAATGAEASDSRILVGQHRLLDAGSTDGFCESGGSINLFSRWHCLWPLYRDLDRAHSGPRLAPS